MTLDDYIDDADDECWKCGGEGYVSDCWEEFACVDPEGGCDECTRRCDICNRKPASEPSDDGSPLKAGMTEEEKRS